MLYVITIRHEAEKVLRAFPVDIQKRIVELIQDLARQPRPMGVTKIRGVENTYRIYFGSYRIVYEINDKAKLVRVVRIGGRKDVYK